MLLTANSGYSVPSPTVVEDFARVYQQNDKKAAALLRASGTKPRAILASVAEYLQLDAGVSQTTDITFATRVRTRISGGKWAGFAPIFVGASVAALRSPVGTPNSAPYTVAWALELANGVQTPGSFASLNTGGTIVGGTIGGHVDGIIDAGEVVFGDMIFATDFGLPYFQFTDRTLLPWVRCAFQKTNANDNIGAVTVTEYNYPSNSCYATCSSFAVGKALILAQNANFNSGGDNWGAGDPQSLPSCIGFIGIPLDGQKGFVFFGTSILDGDGAIEYRQGGVNPANNTPANYDQLGWPSAFAQNLSNSVPVFNFAVGGSAALSTFSDNPTDRAWSTDANINNIRYILSEILPFSDVLVFFDVHNDSGATAPYADILQKGTEKIRRIAPSIKIFGCRVPNGYTDITNTFVPYNAGGLDPRWTAQDAMVTNGYWDGMLSVRDPGVNEYPDKGPQVTSITTSDGSTTTLNDSTATWLNNQWVGSWVSVGGVKRAITANTRTQLTFAAMGGAVLNATNYLILGNMTADGTHPNANCQRTMLPTNFKMSLSNTGMDIRYFSRTS